MSRMPLPEIVKDEHGFRFMIDGRSVRLLAGELFNSSSSSAEFMKPLWQKLRAMNLNTLIASASWELIEPEQGKYTFESFDHLIYSAREYGMKLVVIWFGIWKNGGSAYVPEWVKTDRVTYFRARRQDGKPLYAVSPLCDACIEADARAFTALMRHIREIDEDERTVIMMQVENETGIYGTGLDSCAAARKAFEEPVPEELAESLKAADMTPELSRVFTGDTANWKACFGSMANECFMAYYTARALEIIASAGFSEYPIPMYTNCWGQQYSAEPAKLRPLGGPDPSVWTIWKVTAPTLSAIGADLYEENFADECRRFMIGGRQPLVIPEIRRDRWSPAMVLYALSLGALMTAPFGIDGLDTEIREIPANVQGVHQTMSRHDCTDLIASIYRTFTGMASVMDEALREGRMRGVMQGKLVQDGFDLGTWHVRATFPGFVNPDTVPGSLLAIREGENTFLLIGLSCVPEILPLDHDRAEIVTLDEGRMENGSFIPVRRLNGVEQNMAMGSALRVLRVRLQTLD